MKPIPGSEDSLARLDPHEALIFLRRCDELYEVGYTLAWAGLRRDYPQASEAELHLHWQAMLKQRRRRKWGLQ